MRGRQGVDNPDAHYIANPLQNGAMRNRKVGHSEKESVKKACLAKTREKSKEKGHRTYARVLHRVGEDKY